jgi:hypothetical protein
MIRHRSQTMPQDCQSDLDIGNKKLGDRRIHAQGNCHPVRLEFLPRVQECGRIFARRLHIFAQFFRQPPQRHYRNRLKYLRVRVFER